MQFTNIHAWRTDPEIPIDPMVQINRYIGFLNCSLKNWQVVVVSPSVREIYFETLESVPKPDQIQGFQKRMREEAMEIAPKTKMRGKK